MQLGSRILTTAIVAALAAVGAAATANAACSLPGKWQMYAIFQPSNGAVGNCNITIAPNGNITGNCTGYNVGQAANTGPITGKFTVDAKCNLAGSYTPSGFPLTTIKAGHINGNNGSGIATRGGVIPAQVRLFVLVKE